MTREERDLRDLAEWALACRERCGFRERLLDLLDSAVGFDKASMQSTGGLMDECARGYDRIAELEHVSRYMSEFEPQELSAASSGRAFIDVDALSAQRRDRLSLYHRFLRPERVTVFVNAMWRDQHGAIGIALARTGRGARFTASELRTIDQLLPTIQLADAFVGARQQKPRIPSLEAWADDMGLSAREQAVTDLVVRGLANREIAALLGVSPNTIRNQLASVFRKADVSTRAELVFVATSFGPSQDSAAEQPRWLTHLR